MLEWLRSAWAELLGVVDVLLGLVGFGITIFVALKAKSAAEDASRAVADMRRRLAQVNTAADIASAVELMEQVRRLHRENKWSELPERYAVLRTRLIVIKSDPTLAEQHQTALQSALTQLGVMDAQVERCLSGGGDERPLVHRLNTTLASEIDKVNEVLAYVRRQVELDHAR